MKWGRVNRGIKPSQSMSFEEAGLEPPEIHYVVLLPVEFTPEMLACLEADSGFVPIRWIDEPSA